MKCPTCNTENPDSAKVCSFCNTPLQPSRAGLSGKTKVAAAPVFSEFTQGDIIAGRYVVKRLLGRGGMGAVYLAADEKLENQEVALKVISPSLVDAPEIRQRFAREVLAAQSLTHQRIIKVFHLDEFQGLHFFTMEYLPGRSLREIMVERFEQGRVFSLEEAAAVIQPILSALTHAHSKKVIHRDLKPENIIVSGDFPEIDVKVVDFGLARIMSPSRLTSSALAMGTAYYMSPEQLSGKSDIDARSDLFAVGVILYELLTGEILTACLICRPF